ncbi:MAG: TolC family protein [Candidatus Omnitrophica bacterium]|nr:TolC family protein [Candidatus Omnitrophota bacterium]MCM8797895.1 TolC family protein [Candidatus Omnitrophota bacterium]
MRKYTLFLRGTLCGFLFLLSGVKEIEGKVEERSVDKIEIKERKEMLRMIITTSGPLNYSVYETELPPRIILDFIGTHIYSQLSGKTSVEKGQLREINLRWYGKPPEKEGERGKVDLLEIVLRKKVKYKVFTRDNQVIVDLELPGFSPEKLSEEKKEEVPLVKFAPKFLEEKEGWEDWVEIALANYKPLHIAQEQVELAQMRVREARRMLFPITVVKASQTKGDTSVRDVSFRERSFGIQMEQPLTQGGELRYKWEQAQVNLDIAQREYERIKADYILEVKRAYYNLLIYIMNAGIYEEIFEEAERFLEMAKRHFEEKLITQLEFLNVQSLYSQVKYQLVAAQKDRTLAELTFKQVLNLDSTVPLEIEPWLKFEKLDLNLQKCKEIAFKKRPELSINELIVKFNELGQKVADAKERLKVSLSGFLGRSGSAYETEPLNLKTDWFLGLKLSKAFGGNTLNTTLTKEETVPRLSLSQEKTGSMSAGAEFSLLDGLARFSEKKSANVEYLRAVNELWEVRKTIESEVVNSFNEYQKALYQLDNVLERIQFQKKRVEVTEARWKLNEAGISDVLEAKIALASERAYFNNLLANYYGALSALTKACGLYKYAELIQGVSPEIFWQRVAGPGELDYTQLHKEVFIPKGDKIVKLEELPGGKIIAVNNEAGFAIVNLGEEQGVREGVELWVYHQKEKVGVLKVSKSKRTTSSCKIARAEGGMKIRLGDEVRVIP